MKQDPFDQWIEQLATDAALRHLPAPPDGLARHTTEGLGAWADVRRRRAATLRYAATLAGMILVGAGAAFTVTSHNRMERQVAQSSPKATAIPHYLMPVPQGAPCLRPPVAGAPARQPHPSLASQPVGTAPAAPEATAIPDGLFTLPDGTCRLVCCNSACDTSAIINDILDNTAILLA